ncbi:lipopolysaccharide biosynthesis protein [Sphingomonas sp.]|jgi:O-antigen/teichoic acid export membrane protein|uniref:lipopolysaccharide biosynthesis protein n=1 Tax=Sphingomonas sp. TaxID=28214 RepID=UPI002EDB7714
MYDPEPTTRSTKPSKRPPGGGGFAHDLVGVATSRIAVKAAQFLSGLLVARLLGPEGRGLIAALSVPAQIAVNISEMGIRQSTAFHLGRGLYPAERLVPTLLSLAVMASAAAMLLSFGWFELAGVAADDWGLRLLAVAAIPFSLVASYASGVFLGRQRIAAFRRASWRPALINLLLVALLGWGFRLGVKGVLVASVAGSAAGAAYALWLLHRDTPLRLGFDRGLAAALQSKGVSYAAAMVVLLLNYRIMILLLTRLGSLREVGLYAQAIVIAELIWEVPSVLGSLVLSRGVNAQDERAFSAKLLALTRFSFLASLLIAGGLAIVAKYLFPLLYGARFADSAEICLLLLPGIAAFIVFKLLNTDLAGRGKPWAAMVVMIPVLVLNVALGLWLIPRSGAAGAAIASSLGYVVATVGYVVLYARVTGIRMREIVLPQSGDWVLARRAMDAILPRRLRGK